jgi:hypothetical protein
MVRSVVRIHPELSPGLQELHHFSVRDATKGGEMAT